MKVVFRCDAGGESGLGRLTRCWALAEAFRKAGTEAAFAVYGPERSLPEKAGFPVTGLLEPRGPEHDRTLAELTADAELVIADADGLGALDLMRLRSAVHPAKVAVIDLGPGRYIPAAAIINPGPAAYLSRYEHPVDCRSLLGPTYALVRPDVAALTEQPRENDGLPKIVLALGTREKSGLTQRVLSLLDNLDGNFSIAVVTGPSVSGFGQLKEGTHKLTLVKEPDQMSAAFHGAFLAICAGTTTAMELACLGVPAAYLSVTSEETDAAQSLARAGAGFYLGRGEAVSDDLLSEQLRILLRQKASLQSMSRTAARLVDGGGADRVVAKLSKYGIVRLG